MLRFRASARLGLGWAGSVWGGEGGGGGHPAGLGLDSHSIGGFFPLLTMFDRLANWIGSGRRVFIFGYM